MMHKAAPCYTWLFWSVALFGLVLDQATKYGIFSILYNEGRGDEIEVVPSAFKLVAQYTNPPQQETGEGLFSRLRTLSGDTLPYVNRGALFGIGGGSRDGNTLFAIVSVASALAIIYLSIRTLAARDRFLCLALGLILAGTLGNLYDRLVFNGVRDFLWVFLKNGEDPPQIIFDWP